MDKDVKFLVQGRIFFNECYPHCN